MREIGLGAGGGGDGTAAGHAVCMPKYVTEEIGVVTLFALRIWESGHGLTFFFGLWTEKWWARSIYLQRLAPV